MTTRPNSIPFEIPPEIAAEMTPAVKAFVLTLMVRIGQLEAQVLLLFAQVQKLTPRNSISSTQH